MSTTTPSTPRFVSNTEPAGQQTSNGGLASSRAVAQRPRGFYDNFTTSCDFEGKEKKIFEASNNLSSYKRRPIEDSEPSDSGFKRRFPSRRRDDYETFGDFPHHRATGDQLQGASRYRTEPRFRILMKEPNQNSPAKGKYPRTSHYYHEHSSSRAHYYQEVTGGYDHSKYYPQDRYSKRAAQGWRDGRRNFPRREYHAQGEYNDEGTFYQEDDHMIQTKSSSHYRRHRF